MFSPACFLPSRDDDLVYRPPHIRWRQQRPEPEPDSDPEPERPIGKRGWIMWILFILIVVQFINMMCYCFHIVSHQLMQNITVACFLLFLIGKISSTIMDKFFVAPVAPPRDNLIYRPPHIRRRHQRQLQAEPDFDPKLEPLAGGRVWITWFLFILVVVGIINLICCYYHIVSHIR